MWMCDIIFNSYQKTLRAAGEMVYPKNCLIHEQEITHLITQDKISLSALIIICTLCIFHFIPLTGHHEIPSPDLVGQ